MITTIPHDNCVCLPKLAADNKPLNYRNGSQLIEIDTNTTYLFDAEHDTWLKYTGGGFNMFASINEHVYMLVGLSSDTKPVNELLGSGTRFIEMDTSKTFIYDAKNKRWLNYETPGGGGGGGTPSYDGGEIVDNNASGGNSGSSSSGGSSSSNSGDSYDGGEIVDPDEGANNGSYDGGEITDPADTPEQNTESGSSTEDNTPGSTDDDSYNGGEYE